MLLGVLGVKQVATSIMLPGGIALSFQVLSSAEMERLCMRRCRGDTDSAFSFAR